MSHKMNFILKITAMFLYVNLNGVHMKPLDPYNDTTTVKPSKDSTEFGKNKIPEATFGVPGVTVISNDMTDSVDKTWLLRNKIKDASANRMDSIDAKDDSDEATDEKDMKSMLVKYDTDDGNSCLLDNIKGEVLWWTYPNGTLKIVNVKYSNNTYLDLSNGNMLKDVDLRYRPKIFYRSNSNSIEVFSAAYNLLTEVPFRALSSMKSLKFLTLRGNQFATIMPDMQEFENFINETWPEAQLNMTAQEKCQQDLAENSTSYYQDCYVNYPYNNSNNTNTNNINTNKIKLDDMAYWQYKYYYHKYFGKKKGVIWAKFPVMPSLVELDISNCSIEFLTKDVFENVTNLRRLFMSHNKMMVIPYDAFMNIQSVQYLDLSFTNVLNYNYQLTMPTLEVVMNLVYGLKIEQNAFKLLPELVYLDLSHSKMTRNSAVAITHLGEKLKYLSLCFTAFPMVSNAMFKNTAIEGLDLSGNPFLSYNILDDAFDGIANTLKYLYFHYSNLKDVDWSKSLTKLQVLGLAGNNLNVVTADTFQSLKSLQVLDLSSNHVGNWYKRAFHNNSALRVLNLRDNNINIITTEMLKDFELLEYLGLGENNFVCDCLLRDLVDTAADNNKKAECSYERLYQAGESFVTNMGLFQSNASVETLNIEQKLWLNYVPKLEQSYQNMKVFKRLHNVYTLRFLSQSYNPNKCPTSKPHTMPDKLNETTVKFQLLDYDEEHYWCYNETEQQQVGELNCQARMLSELETELHSLTTTVVAVVVSFMGITILGVIVYLKRWHIHYYYSSLKSAALLSSASKESIDNFNHMAEHDPNVIYDIFISYCQNDRQWVLDELLPNVEESGDVSICLHERDFQIGVTILDNIISCMDRSRSLMLIISSKFLLSHWCQFEMYLAQHRIFEVSKEHLILVFLEDIPRSKRPKTLQYLMDVKTYIKWPVGKNDKRPKLEERKIFWKRLRRSLEYIGITPNNSKG